MTDSQKENRKYKRHGTQGELQYNFSYDVKTKMEFQIEDENYVQGESHSFSALSKNLSVEGMCFISDKKLEQGTPLHLSLYLPECNERVEMEGEVKWSALVSEEGNEEKIGKQLFSTGIKLWKVNGEPVSESIYYDELFKLQWSVVLESVFGRYRLIMDEKKKDN